jgi:hypothetical protein
VASFVGKRPRRTWPFGQKLADRRDRTRAIQLASGKKSQRRESIRRQA